MRAPRHSRLSVPTELIHHTRNAGLCEFCDNDGRRYVLLALKTAQLMPLHHESVEAAWIQRPLFREPLFACEKRPLNVRYRTLCNRLRFTGSVHRAKLAHTDRRDTSNAFSVGSARFGCGTKIAITTYRDFIEVSILEHSGRRRMPQSPDTTLTSLDLSSPIWDGFFTVAPLVVIGTREPDGSDDLAPKHMVTALGWDNIFGFVCTESHGTYRGVATTTSAGVDVIHNLTGSTAINVLDPATHDELGRLLVEKLKL